MNKPPPKRDINEYVQSLILSKRLGNQVIYNKILDALPASFASPEKPFLGPIKDTLESYGIEKLYSHQAMAINYCRSGHHVVVSTPTASGKTIIYTIPFLEKFVTNQNSKAIYLFPLKALAQDQLLTFSQITSYIQGLKPEANIYDGDTSAWHRKKIREKPPNVIMSNPEMLHLSILQYHDKWAQFFADLELIVVDEVHTYRGVFGSHMAQVFRRFRRICDYYGSSPQFIFCSATVGNPKQLSESLTGLQVKEIITSGASQGKRHIILMDPIESPPHLCILLLKAALYRKLRTIVYTQSRKMAELISLWADKEGGQFAHLISPYRAGYLPEERRAIEQRLVNGELLAVISTSALELGIDIGDLDICILVGYPGTIISTWQRSGRVGRSGQDAAIILIAGNDALDQYLIRNPETFIQMPPEEAVINPDNTHILKKHVICAASELPIVEDEPFMENKAVVEAVTELEQSGLLLRSHSGDMLHSKGKMDHHAVNLRSSGLTYSIIDQKTGKNRGEIDAFRAFKETHPGAIYLHNRKSYIVKHLNIDTQTVIISQARVGFYTRVRGFKTTTILHVYESHIIKGTQFFSGRIKVTDQITGYEKWDIKQKKQLTIVPLSLPPIIFETDALWFLIPEHVEQKSENQQYHFKGGIHAIEHASIGIFPFLVLTDRNDLGGMSFPFHEQTQCASIFIYDAIPDGAGLSRQAFVKSEKLLMHTFNLIQHCTCESGCPACVHSPKCGSGNRPIDKHSAIFILKEIIQGPKFTQKINLPSSDHANTSDECVTNETTAKPVHSIVKPTNTPYFGVFDIETQLSAAEVGGWHRADLMKVSCVVLYDSKKDMYLDFQENQIEQFIKSLKEYDLIIGFNIIRFDYRVLSGYSDDKFLHFPNLDLLVEVHKQLGYRLSLDHLSRVTLGAQKSGNGLEALKWWKEGKIQQIIEYCKKDVELTKDLYLFGKQNQYVLFENKAGQQVRLPVSW